MKSYEAISFYNNFGLTEHLCFPICFLIYLTLWIYYFNVIILLIKVVKVLVIQSCLTLCISTDCSLSGSSVHEILQARTLEYQLPFYSPGDIPGPGIKALFLLSPAFQADSLPTEPSGKNSTPGNFPNQGLNLHFLCISSIAGRFVTADPLGKPYIHI